MRRRGPGMGLGWRGWAGAGRWAGGGPWWAFGRISEMQRSLRPGRAVAAESTSARPCPQQTRRFPHFLGVDSRKPAGCSTFRLVFGPKTVATCGFVKMGVQKLLQLAGLRIEALLNVGNAALVLLEANRCCKSDIRSPKFALNVGNAMLVLPGENRCCKSDIRERHSHPRHPQLFANAVAAHGFDECRDCMAARSDPAAPVRRAIMPVLAPARRCSWRAFGVRMGATAPRMGVPAPADRSLPDSR